MTKKELLKEVRQKIKSANERLGDMRSKGYGNLSIIGLAFNTQKKITGLSYRGLKKDDGVIAYDKRKFGLGKAKGSKQELLLLDMALSTFLNSDWTTDDGRERIYEKNIKWFMENKNVSRESAINLIDIFSTDIAHKVIEKGLLGSSQLIDSLYAREGNEVRDVEIALQSIFEDENIEVDEAKEKFDKILEELKKQRELKKTR